MSSDQLNPTRMSKVPKALKAERTLHRITFNPSSAKPGETLYVTLPKLGENMVIVQNSLFLRFDLIVAKGQANNTVVQNVSRNLVENMKVTFGGKTIKDTDRQDIFEGYHDMLCIEQDMMSGITPENYRKIRSSAGDATASIKQSAHGMGYMTKHQIPLNHPIIDAHGAFYPKALLDQLKFQMKLAGKDSVVKTSDATKDYSYELKIFNLNTRPLPTKPSHLFQKISI